MVQRLSENFIAELFKICLSNRNIFEVSKQFVKYTYLPSKHQKEVWKSMCDYYETSHELITLGVLSQQFQFDKDTVSYLGEIKSAAMPNKDEVLNQMEQFVKSSMFVSAYDKMGDAFNKGDKDTVYELINDLSEDFSNFSIRENYYDKIFGSFHDRNDRRRLETELGNNKSLRKVPLGIDELDFLLRGGLNETDTACFLAQSGVGKTKLLRWLGVSAARRGYKVVHIQAEGSKQECLDGYDATFSAAPLGEVEKGMIPEALRGKIRKITEDVTSKGGEIFVESFEQFDSANMADVRQIVIDLEKTYGKIDMVLIDYLELLDPGDGKKYSTSNEGERKRRLTVAEKMKNIAVEFNTRVVTATQASTVTPELLNNPEFVQTRYNISEFKGIVKPFSLFVTLNQTKEEYEMGEMRLYVDKLRKYKGGQIIKINQAYSHEKFYSRQKTIANGFYKPMAA